MALEQLGKNGCQNSSVWNFRKRKQIYEVLLETLSGLLLLQKARRPNWLNLPQIGLALLKLARKVWVGRSPLWSPQRLESFEREYLNFKLFHLYSFKKNYYYLKKNNYAYYVQQQHNSESVICICLTIFLPCFFSKQRGGIIRYLLTSRKPTIQSEGSFHIVFSLSFKFSWNQLG